jgi:hypothetical protein
MVLMRTYEAVALCCANTIVELEQQNLCLAGSDMLHDAVFLLALALSCTLSWYIPVMATLVYWYLVLLGLGWLSCWMGW